MLLVGLFSLEHTASAQPSAQPSEPAESTDDRVISIAQEHIIQGQEALKRGDFSGALSAFRSAQRFVPDVKNLISISGILQRLGDCPGAYRAWLDALILCQDCQYKDSIFQKMTEGTRPCTSTLRINSMPSAHVKLDDLKLWKTPVEIPALHGSHTLEVSEPGYLTTRHAVNIDASRAFEEVDITLDLQGASAAFGPVNAPQTLSWAQPVAPQNSDLRFKGALGFFAVSVIGVGVTTFMAFNPDRDVPVVSLIGGLSAAFLLAGLVLMP